MGFYYNTLSIGCCYQKRKTRQGCYLSQICHRFVDAEAAHSALDHYRMGSRDNHYKEANEQEDQGGEDDGEMEWQVKYKLDGERKP